MADRLVILGSGSDGLGLARLAAARGVSGAVFDPDTGSHDRVRSMLGTTGEGAADQVALTADTDVLALADFVYDAVLRDERPAFSDYLATLAPETVFLTPFDYDVWPQLKAKAHACRFVLFQPLDLRPLTEVSGFADTSPVTLDRTTQFVRVLGRTPIVLPMGCPSIGLRLLSCLFRAADALALQGAVIWEIDEALQGAGFDLGPYELQDLIGLDAVQGLNQTHGYRSIIGNRAVYEGRLGKKIGWGWYRYPGGEGAVIDPLAEDMVREEAWFARVGHQDIAADHIVSRVIDAISAEVAAILSEGVIQNRGEMDGILQHGLGCRPELIFAR